MSEPIHDSATFRAELQRVLNRPFESLLPEKLSSITKQQLEAVRGGKRKRRSVVSRAKNHEGFAGARQPEPRKARQPSTGTFRLPRPKRTPPELRAQTKPCASMVCTREFAPMLDEKLSTWKNRRFCCFGCSVEHSKAVSLEERIRKALDNPATALMASGEPFTRACLLGLGLRREGQSAKAMIEAWRKAGLIEHIGEYVWQLTPYGRQRFGLAPEDRT